MRIHIDLEKKMVYLYHRHQGHRFDEEEIMSIPISKLTEVTGFEVQEIPPQKKA